MSTDQPTDWPAAVSDVVRRRVGTPRGSRRLTGLSGRAVVRVDGSDGSVVVKIDTHARELQFYATRAPVLAALGLGLPVVHYAARPDGPDGPAWLVLEHLPAPLPRERWVGDRAVMSSLAVLHRTVGVLDSIRDPFRPAWTTELTAAAADRLGPAGDALSDLSDEAQPWLSGTTPISGDPNPRNWGVRADGRPVLFDWERIGFGHPAVDLAITVPGLPTMAETRTAALAYLRASSGDGAPIDAGPTELSRALQLIKVWTAVELLADPRRGSGLDRTCDWLITHLPGWLGGL